MRENDITSDHVGQNLRLVSQRHLRRRPRRLLIASNAPSLRDFVLRVFAECLSMGFATVGLLAYLGELLETDQVLNVFGAVARLQHVSFI